MKSLDELIHSLTVLRDTFDAGSFPVAIQVADAPHILEQLNVLAPPLFVKADGIDKDQQTILIAARAFLPTQGWTAPCNSHN